MKINRHGRAKVLTQSEIQLIFSHGLDNDRDGNENTAGIALSHAAVVLTPKELTIHFNQELLEFLVKVNTVIYAKLTTNL